MLHIKLPSRLHLSKYNIMVTFPLRREKKTYGQGELRNTGKSNREPSCTVVVL